MFRGGSRAQADIRCPHTELARSRPDSMAITKANGHGTCIGGYQGAHILPRGETKVAVAALISNNPQAKDASAITVTIQSPRKFSRKKKADLHRPKALLTLPRDQESVFRTPQLLQAEARAER